MNKKIYLVGGKEIKLGDTVKVTRDFGTYKCHTSETLDISTIRKLIETGVAVVKDDSIKVDMGEINERISKKLGCSPLHAMRFMDTLAKLDATACFNIILKEIAFKLDEKYPDHIKNCKEIYIFNLAEGVIRKISTHSIKYFKTFAAFRTEEDAKAACRVLKPLIKFIFNDKQKN